MAGEVAGHEVDVIGEILPRPADAGHLRLTAQLAFGADFARNTCYFASEPIELVDHRVNRVFKFENLAFHIHRDLA